jgi:hypothetical protein
MRADFIQQEPLELTAARFAVSCSNRLRRGPCLLRVSSGPPRRCCWCRGFPGIRCCLPVASASSSGARAPGAHRQRASILKQLFGEIGNRNFDVVGQRQIQDAALESLGDTADAVEIVQVHIADLLPKRHAAVLAVRLHAQNKTMGTGLSRSRISPGTAALLPPFAFRIRGEFRKPRR